MQFQHECEVILQGRAVQPGPGAAADCDGLWACLDSAFQDFAEFRDASLDRWHRKADLASGQALLRSGGLKALNQPISAQVNRFGITMFAEHAPVSVGVADGCVLRNVLANSTTPTLAGAC